mmetsp:Transcript_13420/g.25662  ORF Transcript_13420/g.25662 Transcript_13420/m.25662 type:complete len:99 (+) Transcript_13420:190-486(+)
MHPYAPLPMILSFALAKKCEQLFLLREKIPLSLFLEREGEQSDGMDSGTVTRLMKILGRYVALFIGRSVEVGGWRRQGSHHGHVVIGLMFDGWCLVFV